VGLLGGGCLFLVGGGGGFVLGVGVLVGCFGVCGGGGVVWVFLGGGVFFFWGGFFCWFVFFLDCLKFLKKRTNNPCQER